MEKDFTRVECEECGSVYSVFETIEDERYVLSYCSFCGSDAIETYEEEVTED